MQIQTAAATVAVLLLATAGASTPVDGQAGKAGEILAGARKAIGGTKLDELETFSLEASVQRNVGSMQLASEVEILLDLPDKYVRADEGSGPMRGGFAAGFNGTRPIRPANSMNMAGGTVMIRMGPGGPMPGGEKPGPDEQARIDAQMLRSARADISRLMLGWFASAHPAVSPEYAYAGEAESPDGKAYVLDVTGADGFAARLFVDQQTHLPLMVTYKGPQPRMVTVGGPRAAGGRSGPGRAPTEEERKAAQGEAEKRLEAIRAQPPELVEFTLFFEDWQETGGIKAPLRIRRATAGTTDEEWTVNKVKVNPKIDARKFEG
jgi:hypothetical protein